MYTKRIVDSMYSRILSPLTNVTELCCASTMHLRPAPGAGELKTGFSPWDVSSLTP